jgi:hypothetical protein
MVIRYTTDSSTVSGSSREWPKASGGAYTTMHITATTTLHVRFYAPTGRYSGETVGTYTKAGSTQSICGTPTWSYSGVLKHSNGNIVITATTAGSTIHYQKNYATPVTGASPQTVALVCTQQGDTIEFWASLTGMDDSAHVFVDNSRETTFGGGGHSPPRAPFNVP